MGTTPEKNYEVLADLFSALAYAPRLELLAILRTPSTLGDIRLTTQKPSHEATTERLVARQTVQYHLDKLVEAGLLRVESVQKGRRTVPLYGVNPSRLYAFVEELRELLISYEGRGMGPDHTSTAGTGAIDLRGAGPRLLLVRGVYEGRTYALTDETAKDGAWTIGRGKRLPISLDYDPFASHQSAVITSGSEGFEVTDLGSKNGTWINWDRLPNGATKGLASGDTIGVGRSLLVFLT